MSDAAIAPSRCRRFVMMKKTMRNLSFIMLAIFVSSCYYMQAGNYIGQKLDTAHLQPLNPDGGEHHFQTTSFKTSYQYRFDPAFSQMSLDGSIQCILDPGTHWLGAILNRLSLDRVTVNFLFANADGTVAAVEQIRLSPQLFVFDPMTFKRVLPVRPAFKWVTIRVTAEMSDYDARIRSYQIDETKSKEVGQFTDFD
jgi:hypothetical protein